MLVFLGGFTVHLGKINFSSHRINTVVALVILLTTVQFFCARDFRSSLQRLAEKFADNRRYIQTLISTLILTNLLLGIFYGLFFEQIIFFDLVSEVSFGTYYSAFLLFANSAVIGIIYLVERKSQKNHKGWWFIGFIFWYLALDEVGRIHEGVIPFLEKKVLSSGVFFPSFRTWVVVFAPFILFTIVYFSLFFFKKLKQFPWILVGLGAGLLFWILVIGLESWIKSESPSAYTHYKFLVEEVSEMMGSTLFLASFLRTLKVVKSGEKS
jgi:hypothetical protein